MKILVGCEESQAVTIELRKLGHEAYSCDLMPCSGGHPEWHIIANVIQVMNMYSPGSKLPHNWLGDKPWDIGIFFPTCTYLTGCAERWLKDQPQPKSGILVGAERRAAREGAIEFFMALYNCGIPKVGVENPIGTMSTRFRKPDQIIQPWQFGHGETKATCLWLRGLPKLVPTNIVEGREQRIWRMPPGPGRSQERGWTFTGIAKAMAEQWTTVQ